jgi:hypothetical protein
MSRLRPSFALPLIMLALLALMLGALAAAPAPALALTGRSLLSSSAGSYEDACGIANHNGGLYISDYYRNAVDLPEGKIGDESSVGGPCQLEVDPEGNLYVNNWHENVVKYTAFEVARYGTTEPPSSGGTVIDNRNSTGVAVDPATGNVFVDDRTYIAEYDSSGAPVMSGGQPVRIGLDPAAEYFGLAFSAFPGTAGHLYVANAATNIVEVFDSVNPSNPPVEVMRGEATPQGRFVHLRDGQVAVDNNAESPSFGHVFVLDDIGYGTSEHPEGAIDEFNAKGYWRGQIGGFEDAEPSGIATERLGQLFVTSGNSEGSKFLTYGPNLPSLSLSVQKTGTGGGTVTSLPDGIACGGACVSEYNSEETINLFAAPDGRSDFTGWTVSGNGAVPCPGTGSCSVFLIGNYEVTANFEPAPLQPLSVTVTGSGSVSSEPVGLSCNSGACSEEFAEGRAILLSASPAAHSRVVWSGCDAVPSPDTCEVTMSAARSVGVEFAPISQKTMTVTAIGTGQGTVTSYPEGISCSGACSASFDEGSTVYLMAAPSPGSGFAGFSGGGCAGTATLCAVQMSEAQSVTATFTGTARGPVAAAAAHGSFALTAVRTGPSGALLTVDAPEAGTLLLSGAGLRSSERPLSAGASQVHIALDRPARHRLARHHRLRTRLALGFLPSGGGTPDATAATLRFHTPAAKAKAQRRHR